ncbi:metallophosphoesterase [Sphingobacterium sp. UT-1RO-CII-1]|uniref:metallophosphoesterase family protein n=1 Tax=Sphingobacterium sp. UT-1RO-CII-1 TaxID=2995225 RepID=UPI00227D40DB|nr:metallophosphoesterase [Sphingobacterium sp. UT-1RO-CII-1]MCY4781346.1 metallophosphoesterase [Sphingobacterium sp. UT-1RO-CII-1]
MKQDRRFFIKSIGLLGATSVIGKNVVGEVHVEKSEFNFLATPYVQNMTSKSVTICCILSKNCLAWLEVLDSDGKVSELVYEVEDGMRNANARLYKFRVEHRGQDFKYRIAAKEVTQFDPYKIVYAEEIRSNEYQTDLPFNNHKDCQVLILNDIHEDVDSYSYLYNKSSLAKKDLVILNGDSFHHVVTESDLTDKLLTPISKLFAAEAPFVMVRGNHETRGKLSRDFKRYFDYPTGKFYYSFSLGSIFWIILDGGEDKPDSHEVYGGTVDYDMYRKEQREWLKLVMKSEEKKKAKHTVVINHIPFFHSDDWHGTLHNRECFHDVLQSNKVDVLISGHTHQYGFYEPDNYHNYYVIIGGGPKEGKRTLVDVKSAGAKLDITLMRDDGEVIGRVKKG